MKDGLLCSSQRPALCRLSYAFSLSSASGRGGNQREAFWSRSSRSQFCTLPRPHRDYTRFSHKPSLLSLQNTYRRLRQAGARGAEGAFSRAPQRSTGGCRPPHPPPARAHAGYRVTNSSGAAAPGSPPSRAKNSDHPTALAPSTAQLSRTWTWPETYASTPEGPVSL